MWVTTDAKPVKQQKNCCGSLQSKLEKVAIAIISI